MSDLKTPANTPRIWQVGALCRAIADALDARFNPVAVQGEISGFTRAASGHCYFSLKDETGQIRCAAFRRSASLFNFVPRDGELVEVRGRLDVYGPRGDLQMIVESMSRAGQGALFEQFLKLKAQLQAEGLFDAERKRALPLMPRGIGVVTSLGAAALHDVVTTLRRRLPHIPVVVAPASVQGANAPGEIIKALSALYKMAEAKPGDIQLDVILLVRGGGSIDDLWAFNNELLARCIVASPVPIIAGVGHETDFTIADFCADLRAPTPTAAAELVAPERDGWVNLLENTHQRLQTAVWRKLDTSQQRLDSAVARLGRPSGLTARERLRLASTGQRFAAAAQRYLWQKGHVLNALHLAAPQNLRRGLQQQQHSLQQLTTRLDLLDPKLVLQRGYAWLSDPAGQAVTRVAQTQSGQVLTATLADGTLSVTVNPAVSAPG